MHRSLVILASFLAIASCDRFTPPSPPPPATGTPPETSLPAAPRAKTRLTTATFELQATPADSATFQCSLDGEPFAPCTSPVRYSGLSLGNHVFRAYATLADGRFDPSPASHAWQIHATPVETAITTAPQPATSTPSALFAFSSPSDPDATFQCSLDGAAFAACTSPQSLSGLADGMHRFQVRAVDPDGVADETPAEVIWRVDASAPAVEILQAPTGVVAEPQFTFIFRATEEGVRLFCKLDSSAYAPCQSPYTASGLTPGPHQFAVLAEDAAGNRSTPATADFMVLWALGTACAADGDCQSGFCRDGVCCNEACNATCRSCNLTRGTCLVVRNAIDLDSCSGDSICDDNGACGPRSTDPLFDGFELRSPSFRFRGNFPAGRVELQSSQFRFQGRIGVMK